LKSRPYVLAALLVVVLLVAACPAHERRRPSGHSCGDARWSISTVSRQALWKHGSCSASSFNRILIRHSSKFLDRGMDIAEVNFVRAGTIRVAVLGLMAWLAASMLRRPAVYYPLAGFLGIFLLPISLAGCLRAMRPFSHAGSRICSSVSMVLRPSGRQVSLPDFSDEDDLYRCAHRYKVPPSLAGPAETRPP
jgi:hypothetical protein